MSVLALICRFLTCLTKTQPFALLYLSIVGISKTHRTTAQLIYLSPNTFLAKSTSLTLTGLCLCQKLNNTPVRSLGVLVYWILVYER